MPPSLDRDLSRREFGRAAVALGGASALAACLDRFDRRKPVPSGVASLESLPTRQHAWRNRIRLDDHGNSLLPRHQILLYLDLDADGPPGTDARDTVDSALSVLDEAYERSHEGLIHSMAYSPAYFDRFDASLPDDLDLPPPRRLSAFEQPDLDDQDALLHLASDRPEVVLAADEVLTGDRGTANGVTVDARLTDVFTVDSRRTGFVGAGMPAERQGDLEGIPDSGPVPKESPLFMGFRAGFRKNQASEAYVTLKNGPFAGGTTKHVSNIRQRLDDWYDEQDFDERVMELFSPTHAEEGLVEGVGDSLGADNAITSEIIDNVDDAAREFGRVGHAQKNARANRDPEGNVRLLRQHFESTDDDVASLHFPSLQRGIGEFEAVRSAMNGADLTEETPAVRQRVNNGILEYIFVEHRGNFLVPPMALRALPTPTGE